MLLCQCPHSDRILIEEGGGGGDHGSPIFREGATYS